ncbi:MAG: carbohydrate ABC transporter permease [Anaerolineales bacterium]
MKTIRYKRSPWRVLSNLPSYVILILFLALAIIPFLIVFSTALKDSVELAINPVGIPQNWRWEAFVRAWVEGRFGQYFFNSIFVTGSVIVVSIILSILSGYAFGLMKFPFKNTIFVLFMLGLIMPIESYVIPLYYNLRSVGLTDTYSALILPQIGMSVCFGSFWMRSFFSNVPRDLVDAALVDGCTPFRALIHVLIPIVTPGILTMAVLFFIWTWNDFLFSLIMVSKDELRTLPLGLAFFQGKYESNFQLTAAGATIVALPAILFFLIFQRQFIQGVTAGAVKG